MQILEDRLGARGALTDVSKKMSGLRDLARRQAGALRRPRRHLHRPRGRWRDAQPDAHSRRARAESEVVARRQDASRIISDATGEDEIHVGPADGSAAAADHHHGRGYLQVRNSLVARLEEDPLVGQEAPPAVRGRRDEEGDAGESGEGVGDPRLSSGRRTRSGSRSHAHESESLDKVLPLLARTGQDRPKSPTAGTRPARPTFSADGKYLFFVSARDFNPIYSQTELNHAYRDMSRIYFVTLAKATPNPLRPKLDDDPAPKKEKKTDDKKVSPPDVKIDLDGLASRIVVLPGPAGNYDGLSAAGGSCSTTSAAAAGNPVGTCSFSIWHSKKETALGTVGGYEISADGKKMLVQQDGKYGIIDLPKAAISIGEAARPFGNGSDARSPRRMEADVQRMLAADARLLLRSELARRRLVGDAKEVRAARRSRRASRRSDLHHRRDDWRDRTQGMPTSAAANLPEVRQGATGAAWAPSSNATRTPASSRSRSILPGENWNPKARSPLTEVGVNVKIGDWIVAVNGQPTSSVKNINELLVNDGR